MTEKRFTTMWIPESAFSKLWIARDNGKKMNANDVVDVLNELHTENQELKKALCERNVAKQRRREYNEFWNEKIKNYDKGDLNDRE